MDEGDDGYVPQISQIDYNLMDGGGSNGSSSTSNYYNPMANHMPSGIYGNEMPQQYQHPQMMAGQPMQHYPGMAPHMMPAVPPAQVAPQPVPTKPKRGGGRKKTAANSTTETSVATPLPASYPSHNQMSAGMMQQQMRQPANPYNYSMQSPQVQQQKWPADYAMQQYRAMNPQSYPSGYPMHPSAQNYYAPNQQQRPPPPQYYQQQQQFYPGQSPQQPRYPNPNQQQQQYYADPNMYNYPPNHATTAVAYPQATSQPALPQQKPELMASQTFQQQSSTPNPYNQQPKVPSSTPASSQPTQIPYSNMPGQQQPGSSSQPQQQNWPSYNNGVSSNYYPQQQSMGVIQNLQREIMELERQYQWHKAQPRTPEITMRLDQLYNKICYLKQQLMSMQQQTPSQQSTNKAYSNYPSNGQMMDSGNANQPITPLSSASNHQSSTEKSIARPSTDANSSVAVMQTAASQVQVNITPEATGRTLISVYHQYPGTDVVTNSTNSNTSAASSYTGKESIPPEPVPSSISNELYARNQQSQIALSSAPSTSTINAPVVIAESNSKSVAKTTASDYSNHQQSPIPPQPLPPTTSSFESIISRQISIESSNENLSKSIEEKPVLITKFESNEEHAIERVENVRQNEILEEPAQLAESSNNTEELHENGKDVSISENPNETESFENELDDLKPPAAPRMLSNYEDDEEDYEIETRPDEEPVVEKPSANEPLVEEEDKPEDPKISNIVENEVLETIEEPIDNTIQEPLVEKEIVPSPSLPVIEEIKEQSIEPTTSADQSNLNDENIEEEEGVELADEPMEVIEEVPVKTPKSQPKKKAVKSKPIRGRKSAASSGGGQSRKRKKPESEEEEDDDENLDGDFVLEVPSKKRTKGKTAATPKPIPVEEPKFDDFVEKRRSERTKTERKMYSEKIDIDEDLLEEMQIADIPSLEDSPARPLPPEWIVEKILGVRIVTKMLPKESIEEEESLPSDKPAETEEMPETSNKDEKSTVDNEKEKIEESKSTEKPEGEVELEEAQVEEIYVKFKGKSYMHCEWKSLEELEEIDKRIIGKINRYKAKFGESYDDSEYFNEDYTVVDRVLDEHIDDETGEHSAFIKWRSLPYEDCTWEDIEILPKSKLDEFHRRNDVIDPFKLKEKSRPEPEEWVKIPQDKEYKYENTLRDYQFEGVNWLLFCYYNRQNCILADEMGLGKTIQSISFLQGVYDKGIHGPFLIVVPLSTLHNWEREFETWTDMNAIVYHGGAASREIIQNYEMYYDRDSKKKQVVKFDAILTTYEMVVSDCEVLRKINYRVCIIDEAHRLKNRNSKLLTGGLLSFRMEHRVLLTGTPLQNNIQELFSLLNFLEPEQFSNSESFLEQFGQCQTEEQVQKLQDILKPMMLRRLKEDVEKTLQPKEETIVEVQLTNTQKKYYRAILEKNFTHLIKGSSVPSLMNTMMELRKVCNHPFLLKGAEDQIISEFKATNADKSEEELNLLTLVQSSGKLVLVDKLLPKLKQDGHKVLIFSQMVKVLDLIEEFLVHMGYLFERIDGNVRGDHRQAAIDRFSKPDSDRFIFLLCTRAGGLGINLTAADTVIIFDSDWNPQNDLQAQARCHRIGQTKMVKVYRLITANTYEREMFDKASLKLGLDRAVLQSTTSKDNQQQMTRKEVEDLLKKGAYGAVMDDENEGSKFSEEDIDTILQRRTQTIRLEPGVKGSTFAKASFTSSNNREDIDVNDPNFWAKWAKKANVDPETGQEQLIMSEPRSRRKRFEDNYKGLNEGENESDASDDDGEPGASKGRGNRGTLDKSRGSNKRRRRDDDDDYINYNAPDELTFNKTEFFKVEKLLSTWGWGRWKTIKDHSDVVISEKDIEHIARTLLLHCIREYRGDEKSREFVWQLIVPKGGILGKGGKKGVIGGGLYHEGWATLPEYNPPAFAVDSSFQRHVHRHANKLMQRMFHLFVLQAQILGTVDENTVQNKTHGEIQLDIPVIGDPPLPNWDSDCDKCFLIGIYKHGMENFEAIRTDPKLCFLEKEIDEMPTTIELNTRFKRLILMLSRKLEMALAAATNAQNTSRLKRWPKAEEVEFMRLLRIYGVKDDHEGLNVINWNRFRELSTNLQQKTDAELLEELYCVLAMCTKQQGGDLSDIDRRRASLVESIPSKQAERLMFRLHLMRKIHAIITTGISNVRTSLKLCSNKTMPSGWGELQDEQLMIVVDMHGLDNVVTKVTKLPDFEKLKEVIDEQSLLRRVMEICTTLETGRWNGKGSIEMLDDDGGLDEDTQTPVRSSAQQAQSKRGRKKNSTTTNPLASSASPSTTASQAAAAQALMEAAISNPNYLLPLLNPASGSSATGSNLQQQQLQQFQALMTMYALSSMLPGSSSGQNSDTAKQTMAALAMMGEDALNLTATPKKATTSTLSTPVITKPATSSVSSTPTTTIASKPATSSASTDLASQFNISELLSLFNIPEETNIPVINIETGTKLVGDKAPKLKNLDQWLSGHPKYRVDTNAMSGTPTPSSSTIKEPVTNVKTEKQEPSTTNGTFKTSTLEPGEIPKATNSSVESKKQATALQNTADSVKIGVFYKNTGSQLPQDKWPSITNLESWLNKNPTAQVQTVFEPFAKELLPKSMHDRIGGESTHSTSASNSLQQAASSAAAANLTNAMNLEALQIQLYLQQKMMESLNTSAYQNPYSSLLGSTSGQTSSLSNTAGLDANSALLALFGAQLPTASTNQSAKSSSLNPTSNASLMNEAALTAEILANPTLALLLNGGALTNNNASALNNSLTSTASQFPFSSMDFNTALQLNALTNAANLNSLTQCSPNVNSLLTSGIQGSTTPNSSKKQSQPSSSKSSKLNAVVEKLSSSSQNNS